MPRLPQVPARCVGQFVERKTIQTIKVKGLVLHLFFESFCVFNRDAVLHGLCVLNEFLTLKPFLYAPGLKLPYNSNAYWKTFVLTADPKLRVFLCHSSTDKPIVRELYHRLNAEGWIDPWLDEEKLLPGQDWDMEIEKAVENADAVIVSLSHGSVTKEGYIQKELRAVITVVLMVLDL